MPDAADNLNVVFERVKLTQEAAIARDEGRLAEEVEGRELPEKPLLEQMTLECAKQNPSDLGTKVPENEPRSDQVSRLGIVAVISRFAVLWMTRAKWDCLDDTCKLTRADSASDEAIVSGNWFERWNSESDWNGGSDWISLCIRDKCWSRRSSRRNDAGSACGHEQIQRVESAQRRGAVEHPRSKEREERSSGRLACAQCAMVGETEHVSQQEYSTSTGRGPKLV